MKVSEFIKQLQGELEHSQIDAEIVVKLSNPSFGFSAVTHILNGFDWDRGILILRTDCKLIKHCEITNNDIKDQIEKRMKFDFFTKNLAKQRKHCYEDGFFDGVKWGSYKLLKNNEEETCIVETKK